MQACQSRGLRGQGRTWRTPHQETKSRMMGAKKITEATSGMGRTPGNSTRQPFSSGRYGAPGRRTNQQR